jgi:hypothetical protein
MTWRRIRFREMASGLMLALSVAEMKGSEGRGGAKPWIAFPFRRVPCSGHFDWIASVFIATRDREFDEFLLDGK